MINRRYYEKLAKEVIVLDYCMLETASDNKNEIAHKVEEINKMKKIFWLK